MDENMYLRGRIHEIYERLKLKSAQIDFTHVQEIYDKTKVHLKSLGRLNIGLIVVILCLTLILVSMATSSANSEDSERMRSKRSIQETTSGSGSSSNAATYIRWGRKSCPPDKAITVYEGVAGGEHYTHSGGGSNYLCLPRDPLYENYNTGNSARAYVYGAEYELEGGGTFPFPSTLNDGKLHNHNVPCAVCKTTGPVLMIPARNQCYNGWKMQYKGYLMTDRYNHANQKEFVCMDGEPETSEKGVSDENGALFYTVEGVCGSLPCPEYKGFWELTCVVCTLA